MLTPSQNTHNRKKTSKVDSIYRGVTFNKPIQKWVAVISYNGSKIHIGCFSTPEKAALAYNRKATELLGEYAYINKVPMEG